MTDVRVTRALGDCDRVEREGARQSEDETGAPVDNRLYVVLNWFDELQERLGGR
jgi:hypothetical protein